MSVGITLVIVGIMAAIFLTPLILPVVVVGLALIHQGLKETDWWQPRPSRRVPWDDGEYKQ